MVWVATKQIKMRNKHHKLTLLPLVEQTCEFIAVDWRSPINAFTKSGLIAIDRNSGLDWYRNAKKRSITSKYSIVQLESAGFVSVSDLPTSWMRTKKEEKEQEKAVKKNVGGVELLRDKLNYFWSGRRICSCIGKREREKEREIP